MVVELFCLTSVILSVFIIGRERREKREKRESEKKKNLGGRGGENTFCLSKIPPKNKIRRKRRVWFLIPRGALVLFIILQNFIRAYHDRE